MTHHVNRAADYGLLLCYQATRTLGKETYLRRNRNLGKLEAVFVEIKGAK